MLYNYRAKIVDVHDGDTVTVDIDLGFGMWMKNQRVRLYGINAPELSTPEGKAARDALIGYLANAEAAEIETRKAEGDREKYGRWLGTLWVVSGSLRNNVNLWMVSEGHAVPYFGK